MYTKMKITGLVEVVTGLHIGGSDAFAAIGAVDSPVIRDTLSGLPTIPGSSLKGKMRTLLSRSRGKLTNTPDDDGEAICRVFGSKGKVGRLLFSDMVLENTNELKRLGVISPTEVKFENTINRASGIANPRQIERVIRGAIFPLDLLYEVSVEKDKSEDQLLKEVAEDIQLVADGLKLLEYDYIGGSGSRGYGKIKFDDVKIEVVVGTLSDKLLNECSQILQH